LFQHIVIGTRSKALIILLAAAVRGRFHLDFLFTLRQ
jgi:hypothetical protein